MLFKCFTSVTSCGQKLCSLTIRCTKNHFLFVVLNFLQVVSAGAPTPASEETAHTPSLPLRACQDHMALSHSLPPIPAPSHGIVPHPEAAAGLWALTSFPCSIFVTQRQQES